MNQKRGLAKLPKSEKPGKGSEQTGKLAGKKMPGTLVTETQKTTWQRMNENDSVMGRFRKVG